MLCGAFFITRKASSNYILDMALKERINSLLVALKNGIVERDAFLQIIFLSILTNQPIYIFGRSGSGKSLLVKRAKQAFKANNTLFFGKRDRVLPEQISEYDMVQFVGFDGAESLTQKAIKIILQEFEDKPIILSGERRAESTLSEAGIIDAINISLALPESLKSVSLQKLLGSSFDNDAYVIPEELKVSPEEKKLWLSEVDKIAVSPVVLELIGKFSEMCYDNRVYISVRRWKKLLRMLKTIAYFNDRKEVILTDSFLLGMPIWSRGRNNEVLMAKFFECVEEILLRDIPEMENVENAAAELMRNAEHLMNASDDIYDTIDYAGEKCLTYNVKFAGESYPLYVPERYIGTHEQFSPFNELRQKERHVLCNFEGSTECAISIDTSVRGIGLRSSSNSPAGKTFERFAKIPAKALELNNPEKHKANCEAFEAFRASLDESMENFATSMIRLKSTYKDLKVYTEDPFFNPEFYGRLQGMIKLKFEHANKMIGLLKDVRTFMDSAR